MPEPRVAIKNIKPYAVPLFEQEFVLKLDANENIFGPSKKVLNALNKLKSEDLLKNPYYGKKTQKIAKFCKLKLEQIKITNGADEALQALLTTYLSENDSMLTVTPSFSMPKLYAKTAGANIIEVSYSKRWQFPLEEFLDHIKNNQNIKVIHLTSPNNPTGESISIDIAEKIITLAQEKLVIFDETYAGYTNISMISKINKYKNLVVVKSFSKDFALAGLRIGYIAADSEIINCLKSVIAPYSVNIAAVTAAEAALSDISHFNKIKREIKKSKKILTQGFEKLGLTVYPSDANFILIDAGQKFEFIDKIFSQNGIKIRKFTNLDGLLRITVPDVKNAKKIIKLLTLKPTLIFDMDGVLVDVSNSYRT